MCRIYNKNSKHHAKPKRSITIIIAVMGLQREFNTTKTRRTRILSLKPYTQISRG